MLRELVPDNGFGAVRVCKTAGETRREMLGGHVSLVVINAPLTDENGLALAREIAEGTIAGVLLLVKADVFDMVSVRLEESGVLVVAKPVARQLFDQALRFALSSRNRMAHLQAENERLEKKLAEHQLVNRAKCVLMQYLGMSEEQAHRYIEKQAMDKRQTKASVARTIIVTYEM